MDMENLRRVDALQAEYVQCLDDGAFERWPELFVDPCLYRISGRDNAERGLPIGVMQYESVAMLRDRVTAIRNAAMFAPRYMRHILGGSRIVDMTDGEISVRTNVAIYQTSPDGETALLVTAQYRDIVVEHEGVPRFREKSVIYDTLRLPDSVVFPL